MKGQTGMRPAVPAHPSTEPYRADAGDAGLPRHRRTAMIAGEAAAEQGTSARLRWAVLILALIGVGVSAYLTTVHFADRPVFCGGLSSCDTVNTSEYAEVAGVPIALFGLGAYAAIAGLAIAGWRTGWATWAVPGIMLIAAMGTLYSAYLTWVELAVLHAVCLWCVVSAILITAITAVACWWYQVDSRAGGDPPR